MTANWRFMLLAAGVVAAALPARAEPGDVLQVTSERVNLRSGPSDDTTVRAQVLLGDELIELRRDGSWIGVRVMRTGEEGWIYGNLVELASETQLDGGATQAGLEVLSEDLDRVIDRIGEELGYPLIASVQQGEANTLYLTPTDAFLVSAGREAHLAATLAVYQMWKNHQNMEPVAVVMLGIDDAAYVTIQDEPQGAEPGVPQVVLAQP